jgi:hypothetical protein
VSRFTKYFIHLSIALCLGFSASAQDDLLSLLGEDAPQKEYVTNAFKGTRIINGHSMEHVAGGVLDFRISHRFGRLNGGAYELFGLDQATIRLGLDYGLTNRLTAGIGRSSAKKEVDGFLKYRLMWQSTGKSSFPLSVILVSGMTMNGMKFEDPERTNYFTSRLAYYHEVIIGRKFNEKFSMQITPTLVHRNLVEKKINRSDILALGTAARFKLTKRIALMTEYFYVLPGTKEDVDYTNSLSIGFDIETGGHVFQLHFTNAYGMNERAFITETDGKWERGDIQFGFNISRVFTIAKKKSR